MRGLPGITCLCALLVLFAFSVAQVVHQHSPPPAIDALSAPVSGSTSAPKYSAGDGEFGPCKKHDPHQIVNGSWRCERCSRPMSGESIYTAWESSDTPISAICRHCADAMGVDAKAAWLATYRRTHRPSN